jgi:hypothetical protein
MVLYMDTTGSQAGGPSNADGGATTFRCAKCDASFPWAAEHVGRLAKCACGEVLRVPPQPIEAPSAPTTVASAAPATATAASAPRPRPSLASSRRSTSADPSPVPAFLRIPTEPDPSNDELDPDTEAELAATAKFGVDPTAHDRPDPRRDLYVPIGLLAGGVVLTYLACTTGADAYAPAAAVFATIVKLIMMSALYLTGCLLAARFGGIDLGPLKPALLKIAAVSVFPAAVADVITTALGGDIAVFFLGNGVGIITSWMLVAYLFRLDGQRTMTVVGTIATLKMILIWLVGPTLAALAIGPRHDPMNALDLGGDGSSLTSPAGGTPSPLVNTGNQ